MTADLTLAIETSNPGGGQPAPPGRAAVALVRIDGGGGVDPVATEPVEAGGDDGLIPAIDRLCRGAGVRPADLRRIAVSVGPGGFTGLRIAVVTAKMLAETTGAVCVPVPTAHALIRRVPPGLREGRAVAVCLAWKRADAWREVYPPGGGLDPSEEGRLTRIDRLAPEGPCVIVAEGPLARMLRERAPCPHEIIEPVFDPVAVAEASAALAPVDPLLLSPLYPREPEAVTKWRELGRRRGAGG